MSIEDTQEELDAAGSDADSGTISINPKHLEIAKRVLCQRKFQYFVQQAWPIVEPAVELKWNWHIEALARHAAALVANRALLDSRAKDPATKIIELVNGRIEQDILANVPPGTMKSRLLTVMLPCWVWTWWPQSRWAFASYNMGLVTDHSMDRRLIVGSEWYKANWGSMLSTDENRKTSYRNLHGGYMQSTSVGTGGILGKHMDFLICFPPGTKIATPHGSVPIERMGSGEIVESFCERSGCLASQRVSRVMRRKYSGELCTIKTSSGRELRATTCHPIFTERGWLRADEIVRGDVLKSLGEHWQAGHARPMENEAVVAVERVRYEGDVFNLEVENTHTYFAEGILVHNCDDPHSVEKALNADQAKKDINWWTGTASTRGVIRSIQKIVIMQRLSDFDLSQHIIDNDLEDYVHLVLPMEYEFDRMVKTPLGWTDPRTEKGELLWPEVYPFERVRKMERDINSRQPFFAAGQLQQRPTYEDGGVFKKRWFNVVAPQDVPEYAA